MSEQCPPMIFEDQFAEHRNIAWRVERGKPDPANPLMEPAYPWDSASPFNGGTVLLDPIDGLWKCWGLAFPHVEDFKRGEFFFSLAYAESEDGVHWTRPMLDGFPCMGQERSNALMTMEDVGKIGPISVLVHPEAERERRYELFLALYPPFLKPEGRVIKGLALAPGQKNGHPQGVYRFVSGDGIHWKPIEGPLGMETADSCYFSKDADGPYVAYHKMGITGLPGAFVPYDVGAGWNRILVRRTSEDGTHWSAYEPQMLPDWRDAHDTQFMDLSPIRQGSGYAAIIAVYHCLNQMMDLQFAGSPDGRNWFRPFPRVPCVANAPLGDCGGGLLYGAKNPIEDGETLHFYYNAMDGLHGDVYGKLDDEYLQYGSMCRASWEKGRLWSAVPANAGPVDGVLTTCPTESGGKTLYVNAVTLEGGEVTAELLEGNQWEIGLPVEGFARADTRVFRGDSKCTALVWAGGRRCPKDGLMLRFYLRRARLYGFEWR